MSIKWVDRCRKRGYSIERDYKLNIVDVSLIQSDGDTKDL
jgi:hypothetical protein